MADRALLPLPVTWPTAHLHRPPATFPAPGFAGEGVRALFYESVPYRGRPTRVFAWLGLPKLAPGETCPGMVLLHGGGGTAFDQWVRLWNARGYAAIAMDQTGCVPTQPVVKDGVPNLRHEHGGPAPWDDSFWRTAEPVEEQWTYHAAAAAIAGHSLLAAQPGVDPARIGVTGISWGGYLTSVVAGLDTRFAAAVPVYGCGFLGEDSVWRDTSFTKLPPADVARWLALWDPSHYLRHARLPIAWVSGTNDFAYPITALQRSYLAAPGPRTLCIRVELPHSHTDGWAPAEIGTYMDSVVRGSPPLPALRACGRNERRVWAEFGAAPGAPIARAELAVTRALGHWTDRKWRAYPARLDPATGRVEAELPPAATAWYLAVYDARECVSSTPHAVVE